MVVQLLPASAAPFAERLPAIVVLGSKFNPWLIDIFRQAKITERLYGDVSRQQQCLSKLLSSPKAIWTLATLMVDGVQGPELRVEPQRTSSSHQMIHIEAYIVHVDMVLRNEVSYKLTKDTIDTLVGYYERVLHTNAKTPEREEQCKTFLENFVQNINSFVFRVHVEALKDLKEDGTGELLEGKANEVKTALFGLMERFKWPSEPQRAPLQPFPVPDSDVFRQGTLLPMLSTSGMGSQGAVNGVTPALNVLHTMQDSSSVVASSANVTPVSTNMVIMPEHATQNADAYSGISLVTPPSLPSLWHGAHGGILSDFSPSFQSGFVNVSVPFQGYETRATLSEVALPAVNYPAYLTGVDLAPELTHRTDYRYPSLHVRAFR